MCVRPNASTEGDPPWPQWTGCSGAVRLDAGVPHFRVAPRSSRPASSPAAAVSARVLGFPGFESRPAPSATTSTTMTLKVKQRPRGSRCYQRDAQWRLCATPAGLFGSKPGCGRSVPIARIRLTRNGKRSAPLPDGGQARNWTGSPSAIAFSSTRLTTLCQCSGVDTRGVQADGLPAVTVHVLPPLAVRARRYVQWSSFKLLG